MAASRLFGFNMISLLLLGALGGCATTPGPAAQQLPPGAAAASDKRKGLIRFQPTQSGTVYVVDMDSGRVVYKQSLAGGNDFIFHPLKKIVAVDGNVDSQRLDVIPDHVHQLYFRATEGPAEGTQGQPSF